MVTWAAPLDEIRFQLMDVLGYEKRVAALEGYEDATADTVAAVLEEGAKLCRDVLLPLNRPGDEEGCHYENGVVRTPKGFKEAYDAFVEGGWPGLAAPPEWGGQGLPQAVNLAFCEMICSANLSFGMYPGLSDGAVRALELHGTAEQKAAWLPKLVAGTWSGTMCLTEPHCGTDLGLIKTKAVPADDGSYRITGTKIFISAGEHDLTANIVHLVLAKLPEAPAGTRGISLFLVPKFLLSEAGEVGQRNGIRCAGIEHKQGIKASSTCTMQMDDAVGWLVGSVHGGMKAMFTMMNAARLAVAIQGLGVAEAAYQSAAAYAKERVQGRSLKGAAAPEKAADPIIVHPDVRRMLLEMRAKNEALRLLALWTGIELDLSRRHADPERRQQADDLVALMTPILKAYATDHGFAAANTAMQVMGGHGYIREYGVEQLARDARITQIYEGTNGIQALDLVGRKLGQGYGRLLRRFFHPAQALIERHEKTPGMEEMVGAFAKALGRLQAATLTIGAKGLADPEEAGAAATDYLQLFAHVAMAYAWLRIVLVAGPKALFGGSAFHKSKLELARFFYTRILPDTGAQFAKLMAGKKPLMALPADAF